MAKARMSVVGAAVGEASIDKPAPRGSVQPEVWLGWGGPASPMTTYLVVVKGGINW